MKRFLFSYLLTGTVLLYSCSSSSTSGSNDNTEKPPLPPKTEVNDCILTTSDKKLEIVTWNVEHFPKTSKTTQELAATILKMNVDVIALQEIRNKSVLKELENLLPGWEGVIYTRSDVNLAFLYKTSEIEIVENPYAILKQHSYEFPRSPYVLPIRHKTMKSNILVINNHLKAFGDAKSQGRRKVAMQLLKGWIDTNHPNDKVIVLGDLNDEITDTPTQNVFQNFIDDSANYKFADMKIAQPQNKAQWSYPSFPSHIDHILITNELFNNVENIYTYIFRKCDKDYNQVISDHYPVAIVLK